MNFCIGVDLGGTNIAVGLVNLKTRSIIRKASVKTRAPRPCEAISEDIVKLCRDLCRQEGVMLEDAKWIGVATPGIVKQGVVVMASNLGWNNAPFAEIIKKLTKCNILILGVKALISHLIGFLAAKINRYSVV